MRDRWSKTGSLLEEKYLHEGGYANSNLNRMSLIEIRFLRLLKEKYDYILVPQVNELVIERKRYDWKKMTPKNNAIEKNGGLAIMPTTLEWNPNPLFLEYKSLSSHAVAIPILKRKKWCPEDSRTKLQFQTLNLLLNTY